MTGEYQNARNRHGLRLLLRWLWSKIVIATLIIGAALGLTLLAFQPRKPGAEAGRIDPPGSGVTVRIDLVDVWLPAQLYELAKRESENPIVVTDEALKLQLKKEGGEHLWYALTLELHQENGGMSEITTIDYPYHSAREFPSFLDLLDTISGTRQQSSGSSSPRVHIIREDLLTRPAREVVEELLKKHRDDK